MVKIFNKKTANRHHLVRTIKLRKLLRGSILKVVFSIIVFLLSLSCNQSPERTSESGQNQNHQRISPRKSIFKPVDSIPSQMPNIGEAEKFELVIPDMRLVESEILSSGQNGFYSYLSLYYNLDTESEVLRYYSAEEENPCEFKQAFKYGIEYYEDECGVGYGRLSISVPRVPISSIKRICSMLYQNDGYTWSTDSLSYKDSPDGLSGSGCDFKYEIVEDKVVVQIFCSD